MNCNLSDHVGGFRVCGGPREFREHFRRDSSRKLPRSSGAEEEGPRDTGHRRLACKTTPHRVLNVLVKEEQVYTYLHVMRVLDRSNIINP